MLSQLTDFEGLEPGAWFEDIKTGLGLGIGHHSAWKRSAIVTDVEWVGKAFNLFAWMTPKEPVDTPVHTDDNRRGGDVSRPDQPRQLAIDTP